MMLGVDDLSQRSVCKGLPVSRSSYAYEPDGAVIEALQQLAEHYPLMVLL